MLPSSCGSVMSIRLQKVCSPAKTPCHRLTACTALLRRNARLSRLSRLRRERCRVPGGGAAVAATTAGGTGPRRGAGVAAAGGGLGAGHWRCACWLGCRWPCCCCCCRAAGRCADRGAGAARSSTSPSCSTERRPGVRPAAPGTAALPIAAAGSAPGGALRPPWASFRCCRKRWMSPRKARPQARQRRSPAFVGTGQAGRVGQTVCSAGMLSAHGSELACRTQL